MRSTVSAVSGFVRARLAFVSSRARLRPAGRRWLYLGVLGLLLAVAVGGCASGAPRDPHADALRAAAHGTPGQRMQSLLGLCVFTALTFGAGQLRRRNRVLPRPRTVIWGIGLMFAFALLVLDTHAGQVFFRWTNDAVDKLLGFAAEGAKFVFGDLVNSTVPVGTPGQLGDPNFKPAIVAHTGAFFAFNVLPTIIFFSSLCALLYHVGVMQYVVQGLAWVMQKSMKTSGSETLSAAANIFLGQTEAPLLVKPFIAGATNSELMAIMVGGFANIASGVLGAYVGMLKDLVPDAAGHLIAANVISAPASLVVAKLLMPETQPSETSAGVKFHLDRIDANSIDAAARGALEGMTLSINVAAMLIAFIALVAMANSLLGAAGPHVGLPGLTLEGIFGVVMSPLAWLMGVPWHEATRIGTLLGIKTVLNEFVAYLQMSTLMTGNAGYLSPRSAVITTYALCGFANFSSVAIQIGGISGMAPARRGDLSRLGLTAMFGGAVASLMTACVVGVLL